MPRIRSHHGESFPIGKPHARAMEGPPTLRKDARGSFNAKCETVRTHQKTLGGRNSISGRQGIHQPVRTRGCRPQVPHEWNASGRGSPR